MIIKRNCDGTFHLKMSWPEINGVNEWSQTSNPATASTVSGFQGKFLPNNFLRSISKQ